MWYLHKMNTNKEIVGQTYTPFFTCELIYIAFIFSTLTILNKPHNSLCILNYPSQNILGKSKFVGILQRDKKETILYVFKCPDGDDMN